MWLVQEIWAKIFSFNSPNSVTRVLPSFKQVVCFFYDEFSLAADDFTLYSDW